jgi:hypothetical protein
MVPIGTTNTPLRVISPTSKPTKGAEMNKCRRFVPCIDGRIPPLEQRATPGPLLGGLWTFSQSYISLTSSGGQTYQVTDGQSLLWGLRQIAADGQKIGSLFVKGHGGADIIMLSDHDPNDSLVVMNGNILIDGERVNRLLASVTGGKSVIRLTGCNTGPLAQALSGVLNNGTVTMGNTFPEAVGIPWTSISVGRYVLYRNGAPL